MPDIAPVATPFHATPPAPARESPLSPGQAPAPAPPRAPETLQRQLDEALADADTSLRFRVDRQSGRIVVAVLDRDGEILMQVPDEAALAVARHLALTGALLDLKA